MEWYCLPTTKAQPAKLRNVYLAQSSRNAKAEVLEFIGECNRAGGPNDKSATRAMTVMWMIQSAANVLEVPCLKSLGGKFGEIKVGNVRILYFVFKGDYFFSHGIIKKGQKLPPKHMDRLLAAYKSVL